VWGTSECLEVLHTFKFPRTAGKTLDSKTRKCILVGYGSVRKDYRLYDRATSQILFSQNGKFDERELLVTPEKETGGEAIPAQRC